ncbi:hypothetical protein KY285_013937 [Solanum tuberosum]|nr:hypothetical protein KY285_013937 [Solanum tuberosum]
MEGYPATGACNHGGDSNLSYRITNPSFNTRNSALGLIHLSHSLDFSRVWLYVPFRDRKSKLKLHGKVFHFKFIRRLQEV